QERLAAARIAAAAAAVKAARDRASRAAAARVASALRAQQARVTQQVASPGECAAASSGSYPAGPWGGFSNGLIPGSQLCAIIGGGRLRPDAAVAFNAMSLAFSKSFGSPLCVSDSYRSYGAQVGVFRERPSFAAVPGTSNHGWGLAVDLGCGVQNFGSAQYRWMTANAGRFGWVHPRWALRRPFEPWHWEFGHLTGTGGT
ncbi:MAG: peptidoglycan DL-endopeptidase CwlO, partial [Actinomycetota bacterium]|nr:peptidoglycan DL-endopeptidase CwlO [Actinomycetota bacterium]